MEFGPCEICNKRRRLVRDHDHATGFIRGLLCNPCNGRLGTYEADLRRLKNHRPVRVRNSRYRRWVAAHEPKILLHLKKNTGVQYDGRVKERQSRVKMKMVMSQLERETYEATMAWRAAIAKKD